MSWMHNLRVLAKGAPRCALLIHPDDAERLSLAHGDTAEVTTDTGRIELPIEIDATIRPGVISIPHGWGHNEPGSRLQIAQERPGVNVNLLLDTKDRDTVTGTAALNCTPARVRRATTTP